MAISEAPIKQLREDIKNWECQEVEFKKTATSDHEIAEAIAGFATSNVGRIYLGVDDGGSVTGLDHIKNGADRDVFLRRIANISRNIVKPPIRVSVTFIEFNGMLVAKIDVPKGEEPIYYVDYRAWTRDLSVTRKLEPTEIKNLYLQFLKTTFNESNDPKTQFLVDIIAQMSDTELLGFDYIDHLINPDVNQLMYDIGATAERVSNLSVKEEAQFYGISQPLKDISSALQDAQAHEFYLGMESVIEFGKKIQPAVTIANKVVNQVKKNMPKKTITDYKRLVVESIEILKNEWNNANRYLERGQIERLQDVLRRLGYTFHRLGSLPDGELYGISMELINTGKKLRKFSSTEKYFLEYAGANPVEKVSPEMVPILNELEAIKQSLS